MVTPPWISMFVDVLMGAWAGVAAWLLTKRMGNRVVAGAIVATMVVASGAVGHQLIAPRARHWWIWHDIHTAGMTLFGNEHTAAAYADAVVPILEEPIFQEKLRALAKTPATPAGPDGDDVFKQVGAKLVSAGMARLPGADVIAIVGVRRALAGMSTELCDAFWTGKITQPVLVDGLKRLKERDQMIWASVTARALALEVHAVDPPPHLKGAEAEGAMGALLRALPADRRAVLQKAFATPDLSAEGGCQAFRIFADGSKDLEPAVREALYRSVDHPELVDR
jgi:hypothetical protein